MAAQIVEVSMVLDRQLKGEGWRFSSGWAGLVTEVCLPLCYPYMEILIVRQSR